MGGETRKDMTGAAASGGRTRAEILGTVPMQRRQCRGRSDHDPPEVGPAAGAGLRAV
ncbi:hypothetical protein J2S22_002612 [Rhodoplanes tepidamans]|nr:hypothetical protein [Rhodoplanes tepidamans]